MDVSEGMFREGCEQQQNRLSKAPIFFMVFISAQSKCSKRYTNKTTFTVCHICHIYWVSTQERELGLFRGGWKWSKMAIHREILSETEQWLAGKTGECFRVSLNERWMRLWRAKQLLQLLSAPGPNS